MRKHKITYGKTGWETYIQTLFLLQFLLLFPLNLLFFYNLGYWVLGCHNTIYCNCLTPQWNNPCITLDTSILQDWSSISNTTSWSVEISAFGITPVMSHIICIKALLINPPRGSGLPVACVALNSNTNCWSLRSGWWHSSPSPYLCHFFYYFFFFDHSY